ncbi:MAG TPA: SH3 domain-containing protein [Paracoccaceae bacterium]|nr:SH3 domain-containing protein [Paracoccaceae bacterium]
MTGQGVSAIALALVLVAGVATAQEAGVTGIAPTAAAGPAGEVGPVTNLPLPRFVTLKTGEGNARRGPGLGHRIDWVFTRAGMPLRLTAEHENWRRVEDADGQGGWVHYALLSGVRSVLVTEDMAEVRARPQPEAPVVVQAERGVVARLLECRDGWCRVSAAGNRGWLPERAIWGVAPGERVE